QVGCLARRDVSLDAGAQTGADERLEGADHPSRGKVGGQLARLLAAADEREDRLTELVLALPGGGVERLASRCFALEKPVSVANRHESLDETTKRVGRGPLVEAARGDRRVRVVIGLRTD